MTDLLLILKRMPLKFRLWWLERRIDRGWDCDLSLKIDQILACLEESR